MQSRALSVFVIGLVAGVFSLTTPAFAGSPDGVTGEFAGKYFGAPPNTPGTLLPDPCPGPAFVKNFIVGTWKRIDGVCDDFDFSPGAKPCADRFTLNQEACVYFSDGTSALFGFVEQGPFQTSLDGVVVVTGTGRIRNLLYAPGGVPGAFHNVGEASQDRGRPFNFDGMKVKVKKQSFVCHTLAEPDPSETACGGVGCEFSTSCEVGAKARGGGDED